MTKNKAMEFLIGQTVVNTKVSGRMASSTEKDFTLQAKVKSKRVYGQMVDVFNGKKKTDRILHFIVSILQQLFSRNF